jgi:hypothetical protein
MDFIKKLYLQPDFQAHEDKQQPALISRKRTLAFCNKLKDSLLDKQNVILTSANNYSI